LGRKYVGRKRGEKPQTSLQLEFDHGCLGGKYTVNFIRNGKEVPEVNPHKWKIGGEL